MPGGVRASRHAFGDRLRACAEAGYRGLCLHYRDYLEQRRAGVSDEAMRRALSDHDITHVDIEFLSDWFVEGAAEARAREHEAAAFAAARGLGGRIVNVGGDLNGYGASREQMIARFGALCQRAGEQGLQIALEIVAWGNVADVETALAVIADHPNAGVVIDCWHIFRGGVPLADLARIPADRTYGVQINDATAKPVAPLPEDTRRRLPCGQGAFDLMSFLSTLERMGVERPVSVELINEEFAALPVETAARISFESAAAVVRSA